jgi:hypothetical protein
MDIRRAMGVLVTAVLTSSLLWGGCAACQQVYVRSTSKSGCCMPTGQCKQPGPTLPIHKQCATPDLALQQYVKANAVDPGRVQAVAAQVEVASAIVAPLVERPVAAALDSPVKSPPDLFRLYSVFLI